MNRTIGVIANPASGKDIRRLVSYATTIDNNEKVNITKITLPEKVPDRTDVLERCIRNEKQITR